jgi:hypothetical protein
LVVICLALHGHAAVAYDLATLTSVQATSVSTDGLSWRGCWLAA